MCVATDTGYALLPFVSQVSDINKMHACVASGELRSQREEAEAFDLRLLFYSCFYT